MIKAISDTTQLNNGVKMPWLGLGTWKVFDQNEAAETVEMAIKTGYRAIDTAAGYRNEEGVGKGIRESGVPRNELFITTKVQNPDQGYESTLRAFEESRKKLGLDYIDLYLVHWPVKGKYIETWKAVEKLYQDGLIRAAGVSNFQIHHLKDLFENSSLVPAVNQVEYHPHLTQLELRAFCKEHGIQLEAWSPLMQGNLDIPLLKELGEKYGKTPAQIVLRWDLQNAVVTIPKSTNESRIKENADIFNFELSGDDINAINGLNLNKRYGPDPDNFDF